MKRALKILGWIIISIILMLALLYAILSSNRVQNIIISKVTNAITEVFDSDIEIGEFDFRPFNRLQINSIYIADLQSDTLLYVPEFKARFNLFQLAFNKISIKNVEVIEPRIYTSTDAQGVNNYDFIFEKFSSDNKEHEQFNMEIEVDKAMISNGIFTYDNDSAKSVSEKKFDKNHIRISNLNLSTAINEFKRGNIDAEIISFSFAEQSGFKLDNFQAHLVFDTIQLTMPTLRMELPNSLIDVSVLSAQRPSHNRQDSGSIRDIHIDFILDSARIALGDFGAFIPAVSKVNKPIELHAKADGTIDSLNLYNFNLLYNKYQLINGTVSLVGLPDIHETYFKANVNKLSFNAAILQDFLADMRNEPVVLPDMITRLGEVRYRGSMGGRADSVQLQGGFTSAVGGLTTIGSLRKIVRNDSTRAGDFHFIGALETQDFQLGELLAQEQMGKIDFKVEANGKLDTLKNLNVIVDGIVRTFEFKQYNYTDLRINGQYDDNGFSGHLDMHDPHIWFEFNGLADWHAKTPEYKFQLTIDSLHPGELNLIEGEYADAKIRLNSDINLTGNSLDNLNGTAEIKNIYFYNNEQDITIPLVTLTSRTRNNGAEQDLLRLRSGFLDIDFQGQYTYSTLPVTIKKLCAQYLPHFFSDEQKRELQNTPTDNNIYINLYTHNLNRLTEILALNLHIAKDMKLNGFINEHDNSFDIGAIAPSIGIKNNELRNISFNLNNLFNKAQATLSLKKLAKNKPASIHMGELTAFIQLDAANDSVLTTLRFNNDSVFQYTKGQLKVLTHFQSDRGRQLITAQFLPSEFIFRDTPLQMRKSEIVYTAADTTLDINNFQIISLNNPSQRQCHLYAHGRGSTNVSDSIKLDMENISLAWLVGLSGFYGIDFGGDITGDATLYGMFKQLMLNADLDLKDFAMNDVPVGDARAQAEWLRESTALHYFGDVFNPSDKKLVAHLDGAWRAKQKKWNLNIDSKSVSLSFINKWIGNIFGKADGDILGVVDIDGDTTGVVVTADALIKNGSLSVDAIGTTYYFNDRVRLTRDSILLRDIAFRDVNNNPVHGDGYLKHNRFKNFSYDFNIECKDAQVINLPRKTSNTFYGKVNGTGKVRIYGNQYSNYITAQAQTRPNSTFGLSLNKTSTAVDNDYITFIQHEDLSTEKQQNNKSSTKAHRSRTTLSLNIDVTPDVLVILDLDKRTGDAIQAHGEGNITYTYTTPGGNANLRGQLDISSGNVSYTLTNIIRKEFKIDPGGSVTFNGDPWTTQLNVNAYYATTASLRDLLGSQFAEAGLKRYYVPVNAVIGIGGQLRNPTITYDIRLPNSDETTTQQVNSIINTEEMKTKELLYLLAFNKFYTPDYLQTTNSDVGAAESISLLSSTVTGQINNWLSKVTTDFQLGFNVHASGSSGDMSQEYEGQFMYQPNSRLEINGNFGYRYNDISNRPFFGDIDIEYLLTESGRYRIKGYTHSVDKYSLKQASTIQGVGFVYKQSFDSYRDLFNIKPKTPEQPNDTTKSTESTPTLHQEE